MRMVTPTPASSMKDSTQEMASMCGPMDLFTKVNLRTEKSMAKESGSSLNNQSLIKAMTMSKHLPTLESFNLDLNKVSDQIYGLLAADMMASLSIMFDMGRVE